MNRHINIHNFFPIHYDYLKCDLNFVSPYGLVTVTPHPTSLPPSPLPPQKKSLISEGCRDGIFLHPYLYENTNVFINEFELNNYRRISVLELICCIHYVFEVLKIRKRFQRGQIVLS